MIEIEHLTKSFPLSRKQRREMGPDFKGKIVHAVDDLSLTAMPGRIFSLLGANGAGKTTTLRMVATMIRPTSGSIRVAGMDTVTEAQAVRRKLGFLTGSTALYARLTPNEMVKYFADLNGVPKDVMEKRKNHYFDMLDMHDFASRSIGKLSTGMKQKVSIVRTMIHDPDVVVFDEPTSGLDVITARHIIGLIRECKAAGKTVIFSTHIMSEVDMLSDDLAIIHQGKLVYSGTYPDFRAGMQAESLEDEFIRLAQTISPL